VIKKHGGMFPNLNNYFIHQNRFSGLKNWNKPKGTLAILAGDLMPFISSYD